MSSPLLFDSSLIRKRLARARRAGFADFLVARAVDDLSDRLGAVLRDSGTLAEERAIHERSLSLLDFVGLSARSDEPSRNLAYGDQRRLEIARALAGHPSFMLLDEPFAGIDPIAVGGIQDLVRHLKARGIGVLITDHNVRETLGICDHACIISEGRMLAQGTPLEIVENADVRRVYLGEHFRM